MPRRKKQCISLLMFNSSARIVLVWEKEKETSIHCMIECRSRETLFQPPGLVRWRHMSSVLKSETDVVSQRNGGMLPVVLWMHACTKLARSRRVVVALLFSRFFFFLCCLRSDLCVGRIFSCMIFCFTCLSLCLFCREGVPFLEVSQE